MSEMQAGAEMDRLIAERVMGQTLFTATRESTAIVGGSRVGGGTWIDTGRRHEWGPVVEDVPNYSTDIAAAWAVVERCTSLSDMAFSYRMVGSTGDPMMPTLPIATWFMGHFEAACLWACTAQEAAERICQMALKAIEGQPVVRR